MKTIQRKFQLLFSGLILVMLAACGMTIWAVASTDRVEQVSERRIASIKLADELRQSSDDLTRMARSFAATRIGRFETYFNDILDIRAGNIPYPHGYDGVFWDFVINEKRSLRHDGSSNSFEERMRALSFSKAEFGKLREAAANSNMLAKLEEAAMNAAKGLFDEDGSGTYSSVGVPNTRRALEILFSEEYHAEKAKVMRPVNDFLALMDARTSREFNAIRADQELQITMAAGLSFVTLALTIYAFFLLNGIVVQPLATLRDAVSEFSETRAAVDLTELIRRDEIGQIASGFQFATHNIGEYIDDINAAREELKRNEAALRASEESTRAIIELSPIGFVLSRPSDGAVLMANQALLRMNGLTLEEYRTRKVANRYKDPNRRQQYLEGIRSDGVVSNFEVELEMDDGSARWVSLNGKTFEYEGQPAVMSWVLDVTERKHAEAELQKSRDIFQALADNLPEFITMKDTEGRYLFVNKISEEWTRASRYDMVGKTVEELYDEEKSGFIGWLDGAVMESRESDMREIESTYDDGVTRIVDSIRFPIVSSTGDLLGVGHINHDITELKAKERAVRENEAKLRELLDSAPIGIGIMDRVTNQRLFINHRLEEMIGAEANALSDEEVAATYANPEDLKTLREAVLDGRRVENMEIERRRADGSAFWTLQSTIGLDQFQGTDARVVWMVDISALKDAEAELAHQKNIIDTAMENMDQGISMFDEDLNLVAFNDRFGEVLGFPSDILSLNMPMENLFRYNAERGEYGEGDIDEQIRERLEITRKFEAHQFERPVSDGRIIEVKGQPVPTGGFVTTYTDITERKLAEQQLADAYEIISSSIEYASNIQRSILATKEALAEVFSDHLVIWEPKDVVGGDIYLVRPCEGGTILFLIDCTGHGVPGAIMTMIATGSFDQALSDQPDGDPAELLHRANILVKKVLGQDLKGDGSADDGFECGVCRIDADTREMTFAGARFELWALKDGELTETRGDKIGIGYRRTDDSVTFTNHTIPHDPDAMYYMLSDGLVDQVGGERRRAFGKRRMKKILIDYSRMKMGRQAAQILRAFEEFQHNEERRDDITMVGFKL